MSEEDTHVEHVKTDPWTPPERCAECGATLTDVPFNGASCPHCGSDLVQQQRDGRRWKD